MMEISFDITVTLTEPTLAPNPALRYHGNPNRTLP